MEIATIAGYTNFTLGRDTEVPSVEMQVAYVLSLAELAYRLGARSCRVFTGYATEVDGGGRDWDIAVRAVASVLKLPPTARLLGVQNHHDVGVGVDAYVEFLNDVDHPSCRGMLDP